MLDYNQEIKQQRISELKAELDNYDEEDENYEKVLKQIVELQNAAR